MNYKEIQNIIYNATNNNRYLNNEEIVDIANIALMSGNFYDIDIFVEYRYEENENRLALYSPQKKELCFYYPNIMKALNRPELQKYNVLNKNIFISHIILHENSHVYQISRTIKESETIEDAYMKLINPHYFLYSLDSNTKNRIMNFNYYQMMNEMKADMDGFNNLKEIFVDDYEAIKFINLYENERETNYVEASKYYNYNKNPMLGYISIFSDEYLKNILGKYYDEIMIFKHFENIDTTKLRK